MTRASPGKLMLAKIHVAKKELALTDDSYRDLLRRVTEMDSAKEMSAKQREAVLAEFRRLGWQDKAPKRRPISASAQIRMIYAVWKDLSPLIIDGSDQALRAFCARQTKTAATPDGVAAPEFLTDPKQATAVLEGLKAWLLRERQRAAARRAGAAA